MLVLAAAGAADAGAAEGGLDTATLVGAIIGAILLALLLAACLFLIIKRGNNLLYMLHVFIMISLLLI